MFSLENYFQKIIDQNLIEGSWLLTGLDEEEKFNSALKIAQKISIASDILLIAHPEKLKGATSERFRTLEPTIESVRKVIRFLYFTSAIKKVLIVNALEHLEFEAQNALLKITEEPPQGSVLFFLSRDETRILPTLHSRLKKININPIRPTEYFKKKINSEALDFLQEPKKNFHLIQEILSKNDENQMNFLESCVILLRDQFLNSIGLKDLKISSIEGKVELRAVKSALIILRRLKDYNVNPRLQIENFVFHL